MKLLKSWKAHSFDIYCIIALSDTEIVTSSKDGKIKIWDTRSTECLKTLNGHKNAVNCIKLLSYDELVSSSHDGTIKIWDIEKGDCLHEINTLSITRSLTLSYEDNLFIYPYREHIKIYDLNHLSLIKTLYGHNYTVSCLDIIEK
jgi:WD40 repeat protein